MKIFLSHPFRKPEDRLLQQPKYIDYVKTELFKDKKIEIITDEYLPRNDLTSLAEMDYAVFCCFASAPSTPEDLWSTIQKDVWQAEFTPEQQTEYYYFCHILKKGNLCKKLAVAG